MTGSESSLSCVIQYQLGIGFRNSARSSYASVKNWHRYSDTCTQSPLMLHWLSHRRYKLDKCNLISKANQILVQLYSWNVFYHLSVLEQCMKPWSRQELFFFISFKTTQHYMPQNQTRGCAIPDHLSFVVKSTL